MTPEQLDALIKAASEAPAQPPAPQPAAPARPATPPPPRRDPYQEFLARSHEQGVQRIAEAEEDLAPPTRPELVKGPLRHADLPQAAGPVRWDAERAEALGLDELATKLREQKGTPMTLERGPVAAGKLVEYPMQKPYGKFGSNPKLVEQELTFANIDKILRRMGATDFYALPKDQQAQISELASSSAKRAVAGIVGEQEQRGNVVVDLDPDETMRQIRRGNTAMGFLTGQAVASRIEGALSGTEAEDTMVSKLVSPFLAMFVAGGRSVEPQTERPVLGMQKESKLSWFLRLAPSTAIGSWLFSDDEDLEWGSEEHIRRIYAEGYDITREIPRFGEAYAAATPWVDSSLAKKVAGFGMTLPIILLEPDATALIAGPVGKIVKGAAKLAGPSKLLINSEIRPAIKAWMRALDDAAETGGLDLAAYEAQLGLKEMTPKGLTWRAAKAELATELIAEGVPVWDMKASSALKYLTRVAEEAGERAALSAEDLAAAGREAQAATRTARATQQAAVAAQKPVAQALDTQRMAQSLRVLTRSRDAHVAALARAAAASGDDFASYLTKGGEAAVNELDSLMRAKDVANSLTKELNELWGATRGGKVATADQARRMRKISEQIHAYRARFVNRMPDVATAASVATLKTFNTAVREAAVSVSRALGKPIEQITGDLGAAVQKAMARTDAVQDVLTSQVKAAGKEGALASKSMRQLRQIAAEHAARTAAQATARNPDVLLRRILERYDRAAAMAAEAFVKGTRDVQPLRFTDSVAAEALRAGAQLTPAGFVAKLTAKYGDDAVEHALANTESAKLFLSGADKVGQARPGRMRDIESAAHAFVESGRIAEMAPVQAVLESTARLPNWTFQFSREGMLSAVLKLSQVMTRIFDRLGSRGLAASPKLIKDMYERAYGRIGTMEMEAAAFALEAKKTGKPIADAVIEYLTTPARTGMSGGITTMNRQHMLPADKALSYLKAVLSAGEEAWERDLAVRAMAWSPLPSGQRGEMGAAAGLQRLKAVVMSSRNGADFLGKVQGNLEQAVISQELKVDASQVTTRFITRGTMWAASMHDTMFDMLRAQGGGISTDAANLLNFFTDARKIDHLTEAVTRQSVDDLYRLTSAYNLPLTQEVLTGQTAPGLSAGLKTFFGGVAKRNELVRMAEIEGKGVYVPAHIMDALQEIPRSLTKELEQFNQPTNPITGGINRLLTMWRVSAVNGWILPRPAHWTNTYLGDLSQISASVGFRAAGRIGATTAVSYIPFVGTRLQDALARQATGFSLLKGLVNPQVSQVMTGTERFVFDTADGPLTAKRILTEAHEDRMLDSISTRELAEVTSRVEESRWRQVFRGQRPLPWIESFTRGLETVQHRVRVQTYIEARTGKLTGTPLPRDEAVKLVRETLFDWQLGVPRWEAESIGRVFAFWTYKRNMLRQLGAALTESVTTPGNDYFWKAITGRTKLNRMRQMGQILSAVPETIYWQDPDQLLTDDEQIKAYGQRIAPWWVEAEPILANRMLTGPRKEWYSEVRGRNVTGESLILPSLTTMDALASLNLMANTTLATSVLLAEKSGMQPRITTADVGSLWERNVDAFGDAAMPGFGEVLTNAMRPVFGESRRRSDRGGAVPTATAVAITSFEAATMERLGWGDFFGTYKDKQGKMRYHADPTALQTIGRIVAASPPGSELARNWTNAFDNPAWRSSVTEGVLEGMLRVSGFVRYADLSPFESAAWETIGQENKLEKLVKKAKSQSGQR